MSDILVLGATGFTGRLVTQYLATHPQRASFTLAIAARSKSKLNDLKRNLALDDSVQLIQVDVTRPAQVEEAVKSTQVVISAVGPYWRWGSEVVKACALHGRHYVDLAGEPHWIRTMITKYDYVAAKNGAVVVHSCGYDSVPADLLVLLADKTIKTALGPQAGLGRSLTVYRANGGISGGTLSSILSVADVPAHELSQATHDFGLSPVINGALSPKPKLSYVVPLTQPPQYGTAFPMVRPNRAIVQRSWGLRAMRAISAGEQDAIQRRTYGPKFTYEECAASDRITGRGVATLMTLSFYALLALIIAFPPARWLLKRFGPQPGQGPSDEEMENGFLEATNYTAADVSGAYAKTVMRGHGDPGYLSTAVMISESALAILLQRDSLPELAQEGGVLTPATAFGEVLVDRLQASGRFQFESTLVRSGGAEEGRKVQ